jgi:hypothetical protein
LAKWRALIIPIALEEYHSLSLIVS